LEFPGCSKPGSFWLPGAGLAIVRRDEIFGTPVVKAEGKETSMFAYLATHPFWHMKFKIAILTLATFIALC
jgi:hypothetical protein